MPVFQPMAEKLRPTTFDGFVGQKHLVGEGALLRRLVERDTVPSMVLWGPPGVGKTTLARIIAGKTQSEFVNFSATQHGIKEVKAVMERATTAQLWGKKTIVFVDEIHRFNKGQQDAFLPRVEDGSVILIGATTENPSFEINSALLSRCKVFLLYALKTEEVVELLARAVAHFAQDNNCQIHIDEGLLDIIAQFCGGDARMSLNTLEIALNSAIIEDGGTKVTEELVQQVVSKKINLYDKKGEEHYNIISALHKSMRNSDPQAAVYWMCRMLDGGEDPLYIARRLVRFASEDVGMADPAALVQANAAYQASHFNGMPECGVNLAQAVVYLSLAPKSNALDAAYHAAMEDIAKSPNEPVPLVIRNAPTKLMKQLNYGKGYQYAHDHESKITNMQCLPDNLADKTYYTPTSQGREARIAEHMQNLENLRKNR
ncbi:MAG: replication-associated recombination protein A [Defluviitaleaceae bacterium]|nr:replication-associated recombination protein A [Defluviitaleaceae bacterium]